MFMYICIQYVRVATYGERLSHHLGLLEKPVHMIDNGNTS